MKVLFFLMCLLPLFPIVCILDSKPRSHRSLNSTLLQIFSGKFFFLAQRNMNFRESYSRLSYFQDYVTFNHFVTFVIYREYLRHAHTLPEMNERQKHRFYIFLLQSYQVAKFIPPDEWMLFAVWHLFLHTGLKATFSSWTSVYKNCLEKVNSSLPL